MSETAGLLEGALPPNENTALFGHEDAGAFLAQAYRNGRIHHAVLLEGAEGIGKATLAFRFANQILRFPRHTDAPGELAAPDPASPAYRQIVSGASHDLLHLTRPSDAASGRLKSAITVEEVRRASRFLAQTSGSGNWRIVIVDPADDLNRAAANAILKILEEPPRNALFLVVSHAPGRLLPTIRSRCLPLRLEPLGEEALRAALAHLGFAAGGNDDIEAVIARAGGSVARALMMLRYGGLDIAAGFEAIVEKRGAGRGKGASREDMHRLADTLSARDRETAYAFFRSEVVEWIEKRAREAAGRGRIREAAGLAALVSQLGERWREADAYNLDRKQTILSTFTSLFAALPE
ncbi:DNA polymerase III subunit delta' [Pararhizobium mangrovi]|uniref:DNA polymerase III subunit delta n=1 Tax=Pararhizobium mangrovi TaxID=2590452 RepID=A0A506UAD0_9HYPH|nr:DNA polymerase III subunit delta' [Pararhizobium mangrovi]TPW31333.1 DNA polymerase III subunit delta' [Pararhizobium mangrovi]